MSGTKSSGPLRRQPWSTPVVAGSAADAAFNIATMQADMDAGRGVSISAPGDYYVNAALVVPSGGDVYFGPGVRIVAVPASAGGPCFPICVNQNFSAAPVAISSITAVKFGVRNIRLTVEFAAAHGMAARGYLLIKGDVTETVNGIWPIESIVDADTLTILAGWPSPPTGYTFPTITGTLTGVKADADIHIGGGGTLDLNFHGGGFTMANDWRDHAISLNNVLRPIVDDFRFIDVRKYCVMACNVAHGVFRNVEGYHCSDGVHIYGPAWHPLVEHVSGAIGDDAAVFQTIDGPGYIQYQGPNSGGNFYGGVMRHIHPRWTDNSGSAVFYPSGGSSSDLGYKFIGQFIVDGAGWDLRNSSGFASGGAFTLGNGYAPYASSVEVLELRNIVGNIGLDNQSGPVLTIEQVTIDSPMNPVMPNASALSIGLGKVSIGSMIVRGARCLASADMTTHPIIDLGSTSTVTSLLVEGGRLTGGISGYLLASNGSTLGCLTLTGLSMGGGWSVIKNTATFANTPSVVVVGGHYSVSSAVFASGNTQAINYTVQGIVLAGGALVNFYNASAPIQFRITGMLNPGGAATALNLGAEVRWYNPDGSAPINLTLVKRTVNAVAAHTGDSNNLYLCDNTGTTGSWKKMTNLATTI